MSGYREWSSWYGSIFGSPPERVALFDKVLAALGLTSATGSHVLDAGCGIGLASRALDRAGWHVTGVDLSEAMLEMARAHARLDGLTVEFRSADLAALPEDLIAFHMVICFSGVLDHLPTAALQTKALQNMANALKIGGRFVMSHHDHARRMATDPDDVSTEPVPRQDDDGHDYLYFERRCWQGSPRTRHYDLNIYRVDEDGTSQRIHLPMRAMFMAEVEAVLEQAGVVVERWMRPEETGFYQPIMVARKVSEGVLHHQAKEMAPVSSSRVVLQGALMPAIKPPEENTAPVYPEDLPVNPVEELPAFRHSALLPATDQAGRTVLTRRRQVSLVMLSGGIDSVYTLMTLLRDSEDEVVAHHLHLVNRENRHKAEAEACSRVVSYLKRIYRAFHYTESTVDRRRFGAFGADDMAVAFEAGVVAQAFAKERAVPVDRWMAGFCLEERLDEWHGAIAVQEHMTAASAAAAWPQPAPRYTVLKAIPKREQMAAMGEELVAMCWTCRSPVWDEEGTPGECGTCKTCDLMNRIRAGEETIPKKPPSAA